MNLAIDFVVMPWLSERFLERFSDITGASSWEFYIIISEEYRSYAGHTRNFTKEYGGRLKIRSRVDDTLKAHLGLNAKFEAGITYLSLR